MNSIFESRQSSGYKNNIEFETYSKAVEGFNRSEYDANHHSIREYDANTGSITK